MKITKSLASCFTYTIGKNLYVPITSRSNARTLPETRGPKFFLGADVVAALCRVRDREQDIQQWEPWCLYLETQSTQQKLPPALDLVTALPKKEDQHRQPSVQELHAQVVSSLKAHPDFYESIVLSGEGEPMLRLDDTIQLANALQDSVGRALPKFRITTNGLVDSPEIVLKKLKDSNIRSLSIALMTDNPEQYDELMTPTIKDGHEKVCNFIKIAIQSGLDVETTAVDRPDVDKEMTNQLSKDLKVTSSVRWRPFFP